MAGAPSLVWLRRDLRLDDHPALRVAREDGGPVIPVFVLDPETEAIGAAALWRLGLSVADLASRLEAIGSRLVLRRGEAADVLGALARETGARAVHWSRLYAPETVARDKAVKAALAEAGIGAESHPGFLLRDPWTVETKSGGPFKVFTPYWNTVGPLGAPDPLPAIRTLPPPEAWPRSERLEDWRLDARMNRGAAVVAAHVHVGELAARRRLDDFLDDRIETYAADRDRPDMAGSSGLSENLTYGEISPRTVWHAAVRRQRDGARGTEAFLRELVWREFAWSLHWSAPDFATANWRRDWDGFPWRGDNSDAERWRRGLTGEPMVDAGMREMYVTGTMHNRVRMLAASYLTKHLLTDWRIGRAWFEDCLIDWDPASNALGWQWVAGSGPDAAPYFRVFSPARQAERFDPDGAYRHRFLPGREGMSEDAAAWFKAVPGSWGLSPDDPYPGPVVDPRDGRRRALDAYAGHRARSGDSA